MMILMHRKWIRTVSAVLALIFAISAAVPAADAYAAVKSRKVWSKNVTDKKLNKYNGKNYYWKLPGQNMYACVGYAEWAMNAVYDVSPRVPNYGTVRYIRNYFVSHNTRMVSYGYRVAKKYGGDGKYHTKGSIRPGDIIFFFKRDLSGGKVKMEPLLGKKHANINGVNQWCHIAVVSGKGTGLDTRIHDNSTGNPNGGIACARTIRKILKMYDGTRGATDYQVFRVLKYRKQKVRIQASYEKYEKPWYDRTPDLSGAKIRIGGKTVKTNKKGRSATSRTLITGKQYMITSKKSPSGFKRAGSKSRVVTIKKGTKRVVFKYKPKTPKLKVTVSPASPDPESGGSSDLSNAEFLIWPKKYGKYKSDEDWWDSIPDEAKARLITDKKGTASVKMPSRSAVFSGRYYIRQISPSSEKTLSRRFTLRKDRAFEWNA